MKAPTMFEKLGTDGWVKHVYDSCGIIKPGFQPWLREKAKLGNSFFSPYLYLRAFNIQKSVNQHDKDHFMVITGMEGCLTGDTIINVNRCSLGRKYRLSSMYKQFHRESISEKTKSKMWNMNHPTYVRSYDGKSVRLNQVNDVVYSGEKEVYLLELENGKTIKATKDHKFMTNYGWVELQQLQPGVSSVMCDTLRPIKGKQISHKMKDVALRTNFHPYNNVRKEVEVHRLTYESYLNNLKFTDYMDILWNDEQTARTLNYINPTEFHIHHIDGNHYNNAIENLEKMNRENHYLLHAKQDEGFRHFNQGVPVYSKVKQITPQGIQKTYDIQCQAPHHNFVANGMVVHNSGKSTIAIQLACVLDPTFCLERICFKMSDFVRGLRKAKKGQAFVLDEGNLFLFSREAMSSDNKFMLKIFALMRQKNLIILINIPNFWTIDSYVRDHRCSSLLYIHERGKFIVFVDEGIRIVSKEGTKTKQVTSKKVHSGLYFQGGFNKRFPAVNDINVEPYKEYKEAQFAEFLEDIQHAVEAKERDTQMFISVTETSKLLGCTNQTILKHLNAGTVKGKMLGGKWFVLRSSLVEEGFVGEHGESIPKKP